MHVLKGPVISEKSLAMSKTGVYSFWVDPRSNKHQIADAVKEAFSVEVMDVRTVSARPITKRTGKKRVVSQGGRRKKAFVTLKTGQTIKLFELEG
mgnify:CR=1 FL=1